MPTIRVSWTDLNSGSINETSFNIYRDTAIIGPDNLPVVFDTVSADTTYYDDDTAVDGVTYNYAVEAVSATASAVSASVQITVGDGAGSGTETTYTVNVPSGTVGSDLTAFPLMIDLSDMPASFWTNVQDDGGNVRAYDADGTTLIPHDLTHINTVQQTGRLYAKKTLLAASASAIKVATVASPATKLLDADPNGRNAVWEDYESVIVFPSTDNRTGVELAGRDMTGLEFQSKYTLTGYETLPGDPHQGIAFNGTFFIGFDTTVLYKYDTSFTTVATLASVPDACAAAGLAGITRISDGCIVGDKIYGACDDASNSYIVVFNLSDLSVDSYYAHPHPGWSASTGTDGTLLYGCRYTGGTSEIRSWTVAGVVQPTITLPANVPLCQGVTYDDDLNEFILSSETNNSLWTYNPATDVLTEVYRGFVTGDSQGVDYEAGKVYHMKQETALVILEETQYADYGRAHYNALVEKVAANSVVTFGGSVYHTRTAYQQGYLSLVNPEGGRDTVAYDEGPDRIDMFSSSGDSWIVPSTSLDPVRNDHHRYVAQHNGTTDRRLFIDGAQADVDTGVSTRGSTGESDFTINGSISPSSEVGEGYYQSVWVRNENLSADWIAADGDNFLSPSTFYDTITEDV